MSKVHKIDGQSLGGEDDVIVVPVTSFAPRPGMIQCACGKELPSWSCKSDEEGGEFICPCEKHQTLGRVNVDLTAS
jgi:hypothetical protein